jgi:hypothetical protein
VFFVGCGLLGDAKLIKIFQEHKTIRKISIADILGNKATPVCLYSKQNFGNNRKWFGITLLPPFNILICICLFPKIAAWLMVPLKVHAKVYLAYNDVTVYTVVKMA